MRICFFPKPKFSKTWKNFEKLPHVIMFKTNSNFPSVMSLERPDPMGLPCDSFSVTQHLMGLPPDGHFQNRDSNLPSQPPSNNKRPVCYCSLCFFVYRLPFHPEAYLPTENCFQRPVCEAIIAHTYNIQYCFSQLASLCARAGICIIYHLFLFLMWCGLFHHFTRSPMLLCSSTVAAVDPFICSF